MPPNASDSPIATVNAAAAQRGRHRRASELRAGDADTRRREPQIHIHAVETAERDRLAVPSLLASRQQAHGGNVGRKVERSAASVPCNAWRPRKRQHAFSNIVIELQVRF